MNTGSPLGTLYARLVRRFNLFHQTAAGQIGATKIADFTRSARSFCKQRSISDHGGLRYTGLGNVPQSNANAFSPTHPGPPSALRAMYSAARVLCAAAKRSIRGEHPNFFVATESHFLMRV